MCLTISIAKTEVVVFGGGYHMCTWKVAGRDLKGSQSFTYLGMLFHEDRHIKHAIGARHYLELECANSVQLLVRLQQDILQPSASYGCEVWAPSAAAITPLCRLQNLQQPFLRRACRVKKSMPVDVIFEELAVTGWHDSGGAWRSVSGRPCSKQIQTSFVA